MSVAVEKKYEDNDPLFNPMQTDGFEFVEFTSPKKGEDLAETFHHMGFKQVAKHRSKEVFLYRQGEINFIINNEANSFAENFANAHGPSACAMAVRVKDADFAFNRAISLGAKPYVSKVGVGELNIPAIYGVGDSLIYFVDRYQNNTIYDNDFIFFEGSQAVHAGNGLQLIDHLTNNVYKGELDLWANFYQKIFNFREIRYFEISGKKTGLLSRAMTSPCNKIRIPINEPTEDASQIAEYLREYNGQGIQHIALTSKDIVSSIAAIKENGVKFLKITPTYYQVIKERFPQLNIKWDAIEKYNVLIDGEIDGKSKQMLYQIFTETVIGPIFFELIQREGHEGFGEGNFSALFESMERDQMTRGVL